MFDFVCLGDATQDVFLFINEAEVYCDLKTEDAQLLLKYGQKIPVEKLGLSLGGNAANVAVGLSRLDIGTALVTTFGGDNRSMWIQRQLMENKVDLSNCIIDGNRESNLSSIIVFKGERTILTYHTPVEDQIKELPQTQWVYLTSSSGRNSQKIFALVQLLPPTVNIAYNPALAELEKGTDYLKPILQKTRVLILNWEESETLLKIQKSKVKSQKDENARQMLNEITRLGPNVVVITDGDEGAFVMADTDFYYEPASKDPCVESTGAGDAFSSGFLGGLFYGKDVKTAMGWGMKNAGSVIQRTGAIDGLLYKRDYGL